MPAADAGRASQLGIEVDVHRARQVPGPVPVNARRTAKPPAHVDERWRRVTRQRVGQFGDCYQRTPGGVSRQLGSGISWHVSSGAGWHVSPGAGWHAGSRIGSLIGRHRLLLHLSVDNFLISVHKWSRPVRVPQRTCG
jgi:hypothetical protein